MYSIKHKVFILLVFCSVFINYSYTKNRFLDWIFNDSCVIATNGSTVIVNGKVITSTGNGKLIQGSGTIVQDTKNIQGVDTVEAQGPFKLLIKESDTESIVIKADDNILPMIKTKISGRALMVDVEGNFSTKNPIKCIIHIKSLKQLNISGTIEAELEATRNNDVTIKSSGSSTVEAFVKANNLSVNASGSTSILLEGEVHKQKFDCSGSCNYDAKKLLSAIAKLRVSGSGSSKVNVSEEITGKISGSSKIIYTGNPKVVDIKTSGSSNIRKE